MIVTVIPYNPIWEKDFELERVKLSETLGSNATAIHHIGSTAIPGILAKPIIDILVEVSDLNEVDNLTSQMSKIGYETKGEYGIPERRYFRKTNEKAVRTHHIHIFQEGSENAMRHIAFRDYLRAHPAKAKEYSNLKASLVTNNQGVSESYIEGKGPFVTKIEQIAVSWYLSQK